MHTSIRKSCQGTRDEPFNATACVHWRGMFAGTSRACVGPRRTAHDRRTHAMKPTLLILADGARCRLISARSSENENFDPIVELIDRGALANPEQLLPGQSIYSEAKSGRNRSHAGGPAHGYDDHRDRHHDEMLRRFARDIVTEAENAMKAHELSHLVLIANARVLGFLREQLPPRMREKIVATIDEDATKKNLDELRRLLEHRGLAVAPRAREGFRSRGQAH